METLKMIGLTIIMWPIVGVGCLLVHRLIFARLWRKIDTSTFMAWVLGAAILGYLVAPILILGTIFVIIVVGIANAHEKL